MWLKARVRAGLRQALLVILLSLALSVPSVAETGSQMVYVPAGAFVMGSTAGRPDEQPVHTVVLDAFWIDRHEVTVLAYARFLNAVGSLWACGGHLCADVQAENPQSPLLVRGDTFVPAPGREAYPMTWVSWYGADAYCRFYGKRLPTEAEWEKAARGPDGRSYPWGHASWNGRANVGARYGGPLPVGTFPAGASPYGALDMAGNVWEWVDDWYQPYPGGPPLPFAGRYKVVRGGSWNHPPADARTTARDIAHPARRLGVVGFRCAAGAPHSWEPMFPEEDADGPLRAEH